MAVAARRWSKRRSVKKHGAERDGASKRKRRIEERWRGDERTRRREDAARRAEVEKAEAARGGLTQREGRGPPQGANWNYSARPPLFKLLLLSFLGGGGDWSLAKAHIQRRSPGGIFARPSILCYVVTAHLAARLRWRTVGYQISKVLIF